MSKITRKAAKIFGSTAGANQIAQFGSLAAAAPVYSTDPDTIQNLSNWLAGWYEAVVGSNSPAIQDMNAFCYVVAYQAAYILQAGVGEYSATTTYYIDSYVNYSGRLYVSIADDNVGNAVTDKTKWRVAGSTVVSKTLSDTGYTAVIGNVVLWNASGGACIQNLPAAASSFCGQITITKKKTDISIDAITITPNGADLIDGDATLVLTEPGQSATLISDGTGWYTI